MDRNVAIAYGLAGLAFAITLATLLTVGDTEHPANLAAPPIPGAVAPTPVVSSPPEPVSEVVYVDEQGRPLRGPADAGRAGRRHHEDEDEEEEEENEEEEEEEDERGEHGRRDDDREDR